MQTKGKLALKLSFIPPVCKPFCFLEAAFLRILGSSVSTSSLPPTGLSVQSPLKAALTGLELVLARAQIWEESAAKHVSLAAQLEAVAGLATRWRRLELAAWRNLLNTTRSRHAAGELCNTTVAGHVKSS